jgi:H+/Cl- antiporter ClcA
MQALATVILCVLAGVVYGILHDQVTARVCVEYFTIGHPPIFHTENPTLLAFGWGVVATWWVGAILGVMLTAAARIGSRPRRSARSLVKPVIQLLLVLGVTAFVAGVLGWVLATSGSVVLVEPLATEIPREKHTAFLADLWAHSASYLFGFLGGLFVCVRVWWSRKSAAAV